ncbi:hypothetical protein CLV28_0360 [Sediminihabitans luteus]|uniref:Uncharacterized protein n=1 Tax=Sediminihabitans luteus TaxID=1138585 RepID=A0A2M9CYY3_9CELL|nr:hypothetical protein [Sediminihabitans luteus]PJJ77146.1 hypothetical protein CLV28_0360 [Sediminihabitans luteus]GII98594.1 hypothetical protein Slu03_09720 [Sediminihabitans luteus]
MRRITFWLWMVATALLVVFFVAPAVGWSVPWGESVDLALAYFLGPVWLLCALLHRWARDRGAQVPPVAAVREGLQGMGEIQDLAIGRSYGPLVYGSDDLAATTQTFAYRDPLDGSGVVPPAATGPGPHPRDTTR